jgi:lipid-A-disaccharide synthase
VKKVKRFIDRMFIIFPFEVEFYRKHGVEVTYYGNPLVDETEKRIASFPSDAEIRRELNLDERPVIALLAGSRKHEIELVLPQMKKVMKHFPGYQFVLAGVKNISDELYMKIIGASGIKLIKDKTYEILKTSDAALVTSGTATLETAIIGIPQVVCYKGDFFSMIIAWMVIKVKYISLVNLIMNAEVVRELVQYDLTEKKITEELRAVLKGGSKREKMLADYEALRQKLGPAGASGRVAAEMVKELSSSKINLFTPSPRGVN